MITQDELKRLFHYDENTGLFTRLISNNIKFKIGSIAGGVDLKGYIAINLNGKRYYAHRLAWLYVYGDFPINQIDHINGIKNDNRLCNLREATRQENNRNKAMNSNNTSGFKGIDWHKISNKWRARCKINNIVNTIGYYSTAKEASIAYEAFTKLHYGEFYYCNA